MKLENFKNYDDVIEHIKNEFENSDDITVICDYVMADLLNYYFGDKEYMDYKGIDLQSDVNEYYVTKFGNEFFCITPIKIEDKIKTVTSNYFIIDNEILQENPTLFNHLEGSFDNDFKVEVVDYDDKIEIDEIFKEEIQLTSNRVEEELNEKIQLILNRVVKQLNLVEEYTQLILDNDCKEKNL